MNRGPIRDAATQPAAAGPSSGEFLAKVAVEIWNEAGTKAIAMGITGGIKDAVDPNAAIDERVKGATGAAAAFAGKYAYVASKMGAYGFAKWLGAFSGVVGFATTAYDLLTMMGKGYAEAHKIAHAKGKWSGVLVGVTAAVAWGQSVDLSQHLYNRVYPDSIPGTFEVSHAKGFNRGFFKGHGLFMQLPRDQAYEFQVGILAMMRANVLRDWAMNRFFNHRAQFGHAGQGAQTNMMLPYVILALQTAAAAKKA